MKIFNYLLYFIQFLFFFLLIFAIRVSFNRSFSIFKYVEK
jgi:hypothetical protein